MKRIGTAMLTGLLILMSGCSGYYEVKDPVSGKRYYTTDYDDLGSGALEFKDIRTGADVVIQNSETKELSEEEFNTGRFTPQPEAK